MNYTHPKGKGAGKYNGMKRASDWAGQRIRAACDIANQGGQAVKAGTTGRVSHANHGLSVVFDGCQHCGTVLNVRQLEYSAVELDTPVPHTIKVICTKAGPKTWHLHETSPSLGIDSQSFLHNCNEPTDSIVQQTLFFNNTGQAIRPTGPIIAKKTKPNEHLYLINVEVVNIT